MKNFAKLIKDLGLNETASRDAQQAFVRHLQRVSQNNQSNLGPINLRKIEENPEQDQLQLSFPSEILGSSSKK